LLTQKLIENNVDLNKKIYVAFSGGPDSSAMIHLISKMKTDMKIAPQAIHINHNLSDKSADWESHCKNICLDLNIDLITESVQITSEGGGIESAARQLRYKIFKSILKEGEQIILAHHGDDVAETILMRMLRGTGIEGIEGPKQKRNLGNGILIRPFLEISKKEILGYLKENKIDFIQDDSNKDNTFDRNFLRNKIFPLLEERWNNFPQRFNKMSSIIRDRNKNYSNLIANEYQNLIGREIEIKKLKKVSPLIICDILRYSIKECNIALPNSKIMEEILKTFLDSNPGPKSIVTWSRSDKEEDAGKITYDNGFLIISKK
tara:strand:- start:56 stop:1012 length:957 start_codon:yes stop_codon:yes gene_type:complete